MMEARLALLWRHPPGATRSRLVAADTGRTVHEVVEDVRPALEAAAPETALMMRLAAEAGLRRAEVAAVHADDIIDDVAGANFVDVLYEEEDEIA